MYLFLISDVLVFPVPLVSLPRDSMRRITLWHQLSARMPSRRKFVPRYAEGKVTRMIGNTVDQTEI